MSDTIDPRLLDKTVGRLQRTVEDLQLRYVCLRASLDALTTDLHYRVGEFTCRIGGLERARARLATSVDEAHTKIDRIELDIEGVKAQLAATVSRQDSIDAKLDLILTRLEAR